MPDNWLEKRFERHQDAIAARQRKERWEANAQASYGAFFDRLKRRVETDVQTFKKLFGADAAGTEFRSTDSGFTVSRDTGAKLTVSPSSGTVISISLEIPHEQPDRQTMEIAPDSEGSICYKRDGVLLASESEASQIILENFLFA